MLPIRQPEKLPISKVKKLANRRERKPGNLVFFYMLSMRNLFASMDLICMIELDYGPEAPGLVAVLKKGFFTDTRENQFSDSCDFFTRMP